MTIANKKFIKAITDTLDDGKGQQIEVIDVRGKSTFTDHMIVVSGTSSRHVKGLANAVVVESKKLGVKPLGVEGEADAEWVLVDLVDVVVHVMQIKTREFYQIEKLWSVDAVDTEA